MFADPMARQLYAEIASIEEQHVTQYESIIDPEESWLEKWLLHEATEIYNYYSCLQYETNPRVKSIWERFLNYELGHLQFVLELFRKFDKRDPAQIIPQAPPEPIEYKNHREFVRKVLAEETDLRARGTQFISKDEESDDMPSPQYRQRMNASGSPSRTAPPGSKIRGGGGVGGE